MVKNRWGGGYGEEARGLLSLKNSRKKQKGRIKSEKISQKTKRGGFFYCMCKKKCSMVCVEAKQP